MKYFITGATGFIGGQVAEQLLEAGHEVTALVRNEGRAGHLKKLGAKIATGDIADKQSMRASMAGADGVFHIAAWYKVGVKNKSVAEKINVTGTRNVLELMQELEIKKGVYTSTLAVFSDTHGQLVDESYRYDGPHLSEYDRTKWLAHYQVALPMIKDGLPLVIVQPGAVYGPGDTSQLGETFRDYLLKKLPAIPKDVRLCWAHVDDIAKGHILAMEKGNPGENYIIAGPPHTLEEAFTIAEKITGIKPPKMRLAPGMMKFMSKLASLFAFLPLPQNFTAESLRVLAGTSYLGSNEKAKRELGYTPRPLQEGLAETLQYMMKELNFLTQ